MYYAFNPSLDYDKAQKIQDRVQIKDFLPWGQKILFWNPKETHLKLDFKKNVESPNSNSITLSGFMSHLKFYDKIIRHYFCTNKIF